MDHRNSSVFMDLGAHSTLPAPLSAGDALWAASVLQLRRGYASGDFTPLDVAHSVLQRAAQCEPALQALWRLDTDGALQKAEHSAQRWRAQKPLSLLDGIPVTLKDNIATVGEPMPLGTAATPTLPQLADAPVAARLKEAGAVCFAKTTMPDYGMLSSGLSSFHALARNPWDTTRTPGGSSSGAGAAAAAGYGPLHIGTDIGGSIRLPATWCGVVGFKPSLGRVPIDPPYIGRVAGPLARTVMDVAAAMDILSQPDARDSMSLPPQDIDWGAADVDASHLRGLRIGLWTEPGCGLDVHPEVLATVQDAAARLKSAGAKVVALRPFFTRAMLDGMDHFWRTRSRIDLAALPPEARQRVLPYIRAWADSSAGMSADDVYHAFNQFLLTRHATVRATASVDYVVSPVAPVLAFAADWASPTNDPLRPLEHIAFTVPFNMSEQPAISVPCGMSCNGLPIGVQIAGARFDDLGVLKVARALEHLRGPLLAWPKLQLA